MGISRAPAPEDGGRIMLVLALSLGAHLFAAGVLAVLPAASSFVEPDATVELEMSFAPPSPVAPPAPPEPEIVREPEPAPVVRAPRPRPQAAVAPASEPPAVAQSPPAEPEPAAALAPTSAPPSLDDVFGDPSGTGPALATSGSPAGRFGGTGTGAGAGVGLAGNGPGGVATGPSADAIRHARRAYSSQVHELLGRRARYPLAARAQRMQGTVVLALRIGEDGRLIAVRVVGSSGHAVLDEAAVATVNEIATFPRPPALVPWDPREEVRTSLAYELR